jgi:hypothetical protein
MGSTPKTVGIASIPMAFLLVLGVSFVVQVTTMPSATDDKKADQFERTDGQMQKTIQGDVKQVNGNNYIIKGVDGTEMKLHTDSNTVMSDQIFPGDRIEAKITEKNHALSMFPIFRTEKRRVMGIHDR